MTRACTSPGGSGSKQQGVVPLPYLEWSHHAQTRMGGTPQNWQPRSQLRGRGGGGGGGGGGGR